MRMWRFAMEGPTEPVRRQRKPTPKLEPAPPTPPAPPAYSNGGGGSGNKLPYRLSQNVVNAVAVVVTVVWGISFIADILIPDYSPPTNVHMALMVVLGGVFGSQFVKRY